MTTSANAPDPFTSCGTQVLTYQVGSVNLTGTEAVANLNVQKLSDPISYFHATAGTMAGNAGRLSDDDRRRSDDQVRRGFHERFPGGAQGPPRK